MNIQVKWVCDFQYAISQQKSTNARAPIGKGMLFYSKKENCKYVILNANSCCLGDKTNANKLGSH